MLVLTVDPARRLADALGVGALGNTPGRLHHWSRPGFARFVERRLEIVELHSPLPWTMALCRAEPAPSARPPAS